MSYFSFAWWATVQWVTVRWATVRWATVRTPSAQAGCVFHLEVPPAFTNTKSYLCINNSLPFKTYTPCYFKPALFTVLLPRMLTLTQWCLQQPRHSDNLGQIFQSNLVRFCSCEIAVNKHTYKRMVRNIFEGELLLRTLSTLPLQHFCKIVLRTDVFVKSVRDPDEKCKRNC